MKTWDRATYTGNRLDIHGRPLKGKKALLLTNEAGEVKAQFDNVETGFGHGWYPFNANNWERENEE